MGGLSPEEKALRLRIAAWVRHFRTMYEPWDKTKKAFAERAHIANSTITDIINGREDVGIGLTILARMREHLDADINLVLTEDPPPQKESPQNPREASPAVVTRGRRTKTGE
jgi:hypothetical protein